jgi:hypothetical protein
VSLLTTETLAHSEQFCGVVDLQRLYDAKHRSSNVPLAICVGDAEVCAKHKGLFES